MNHFVLDIGNSHVVGCLKRGSQKEFFRISSRGDVETKLKYILEKLNVRNTKFQTLVSSVNKHHKQKVVSVLNELEIEFKSVDELDLSMKMEVKHPKEVGQDLIANAYGAIALYPQKDIIIVDFGTATTIQAVAKKKAFLGATIIPGITICSKALKEYTDLLPQVKIEKPSEILGKDTQSAIQSGVYNGILIGAITHIIGQIKQKLFTNDCTIVATGGVLEKPYSTLGKKLSEDLMKQNILIKPDLTVIGLFEMLKTGENNEYRSKRDNI